MGPDADRSTDELADEVAELLIAADDGDAGAERELANRYRATSGSPWATGS